MKIEVLGSGCKRCQALFDNVKSAAKNADMEADIQKCEDYQTILKYGVMVTPALVVDGKVVLSGKVPAVEELVKILRDVTIS